MDPLLQTKMAIHARAGEGGKYLIHEMYEGVAKMSQEQQDAYKAIIGDGLGRVTVGRDVGEKDFGNGGGVFVNVTLACDQSYAGINQAAELAYQVADYWCWHYHGQVKQELVNRRILKP